eukprot:1177599-Pyramimonas_sp.AAC.1
MHHQPHLGDYASEVDEHACYHLGRLTVSVGAGKFKMLYTTELLDVFVSVQSNIAVLILGISHITIGVCVLVEFTLTKGVFYALDTLVNHVLSAGHIDIISMFGRKLVVARLELLVVGRGSEARTSRDPSELS